VHERDHWTCAYCGRSVSKTPPCSALLATVDHIMPVSRGGASSWTNLVSACRECNGRKADRTPDEAGMPLRFAPFDPAVAYRVGGHVEVIPGVPEALAA
jgi:5-methylcytosine-specific restriction endonuclease McrA